MKVLYIAITLFILLLSSCVEKDAPSIKIADKHSESVTSLASNTYEKKVIKIKLNENVKKAGLTKTVAQTFTKGKRKGLSIYFIAHKDIRKVLLAKAVNEDGLEIGRSKATIILRKEDATYLKFYFYHKFDMNHVQFYDISVLQ